MVAARITVVLNELNMFVQLTATFVRRSRQSVGGLPGSVVVKRSAAFAVISCGVVSAHAFPMNLQ